MTRRRYGVKQIVRNSASPPFARFGDAPRSSRRRRRWRWVTRDRRGMTVQTWASSVRPRLLDEGIWISPDVEFGIDTPAEFAAKHGLTIRPGSCVRVEFGKAKVVR